MRLTVSKTRAIEEADKIDKSILMAFDSGENFLVEAGAGSGKTYSLMRVIDHIEQNSSFNKGPVTCITYTNVAVEVIRSRISESSRIIPSTIHTFAWRSIQKYQKVLISYLNELTDYNEEELKGIRRVQYELGVRRIENGTLFLYHDDVIKLFAWLLNNSVKFRDLFSRQSSIILIDEYQDASKLIMDAFLKFFINEEEGPQFGFFGDSWQTIYGSLGACGKIDSPSLKVFRKPSNFRSQKIIVDALNKLRPELPQISGVDSIDGEIKIVLTNNYQGERLSGPHISGDLPNEVRTEYITNVEKFLKNRGWNENFKTLMLTHRYLANQIGYEGLFSMLGDSLRDETDRHIQFLLGKVEPIVQALNENNLEQLFESLGRERSPIVTRSDKKQWTSLKKILLEAREKSIGDVVTSTIESGVIPIPPKILGWHNVWQNKGEEQIPYYKGKSISELYGIRYAEVIAYSGFVDPEGPYSTSHGVKGEEYGSVLFIISGGWNQYQFNRTMPPGLNLSSEEQLNNPTYVRTRNLFYVNCSRAKKNLALLVTVPTDKQFQRFLESIFGEENIIEYDDLFVSTG